jgi:hypothetical protein
MKLLLDTNIFLEILLEQEQAMACRRLLSTSNTQDLFISDFSLHSVGLALFRRKQFEAFEQFLNDVFINIRIGLLALAVNDMETVGHAARQFALDFDDAYQYALAERYRLCIVSLDADFDHTPSGRQTPAQITP